MVWSKAKIKAEKSNAKYFETTKHGFLSLWIFLEFYDVAVKLFHKIPSSHHNLLDHPLPPRPVGDTS